MRICSLISHTAIGCGGLIGGWLVAFGQPGIMPSFAQAPAASSGQRSTELFNRVMDDVLGRRLTVRLTEWRPTMVWSMGRRADWPLYLRTCSILSSS
jgi:hypothetical protein